MDIRCFLVFMFMIHSSFALRCHHVFNVNKPTCDDCIRCGGIWCMDHNEKKQCREKNDATDGWCKKQRYDFLAEAQDNYSQKGDNFKYAFVTKTAQPILNPPTITLPVKLSPTKGNPRQAHYEFLNSTSPSDPSEFIKIHFDPIIAGNPYSSLNVRADISPGVCSPNSKSEDVFVKVKIDGVAEAAILKFHVICSCSCSDKVDINSKVCSGYGNFSCGSCQCNDEWHGMSCEHKICRGDKTDSCSGSVSSPNEQCWSHGQCDECQKCQCDNGPQFEGSQYYQEDDCKDLCKIIEDTNILHECLIKNEVGPCKYEPHEAIGEIQHWNETLLGVLYEDGFRKLWINCSTTYLNSNEKIWYSSTKINGTIYMMRNVTADSSKYIITPSNTVTIPVVIGVIAALAAMVAAAAGYILWKGKGALPMTGSNYANIEADNAVVENPLYKSPMTSFKNPTYGRG